jgi:hypothetical protein
LLNGLNSQPRYPFEIEITDGHTRLALVDSAEIYAFIKNKIIGAQQI